MQRGILIHEIICKQSSFLFLTFQMFVAICFMLSEQFSFASLWHDYIGEKCMLSWNYYSHFVARNWWEKLKVTWLFNFRTGAPPKSSRLFSPPIFTALYPFIALLLRLHFLWNDLCKLCIDIWEISWNFCLMSDINIAWDKL